MGKIRIKVLGDEEQEQQKQKKAKIKKEQKQARQSAGAPVAETQTVILASDKGARPESIRQAQDKSDSGVVASTPPQNDKKPQKKEKFAAKTKKARSKSYQTAAAMIEKSKTYNLADALLLLEKLKRGKFDETVELHINTVETGMSDSLTLPHGTGKKLRVAIADDKIIASVEKGVIDFDILLAQPVMMAKLAKVARVLGPKGLMPNPKNGTITEKPEEAAKKFTGGLVNYKTESKTPIIHMSVGKLSFGEKKLKENINVVFGAINADKIKNITLKSTMSPGIKIQL